MGHQPFMSLKAFRIVQKDNGRFYIEKNYIGRKWIPYKKWLRIIWFGTFEEAENYVKRLCHEPEAEPVVRGLYGDVEDFYNIRTDVGINS